MRLLLLLRVVQAGCLSGLTLRRRPVAGYEGRLASVVALMLAPVAGLPCLHVCLHQGLLRLVEGGMQGSNGVHEASGAAYTAPPVSLGYSRVGCRAATTAVCKV